MCAPTGRPDAVERVTGQPLTGLAEHGIIHLINSGSAALDGSCKQRDEEGKPTMKPHWEISQKEADGLPGGNRMVSRRFMNTSAAAATPHAS
ncbi:L-fucose isomerase [Raoultella planticola]|uniref:L-fucose isomerase n=1 Tax=Raoultella planticola TaxID=575 RepID=A0A485BPV1_RAOPL|nr:L-fucose isomerase [Raoultella planticola]